MVQSIPGAGEGASVGGEASAVACQREGEKLPHLFPRFWLQNSLRRRIFSDEYHYREPPTPASTSWYDCVARVGFSVLLLRGLLPGHSGQRRRSDSTPSSTPNALPEEWEDCRKEPGETCMFEWTKELQGRLLPPKWRKILCQQEQHVSVYKR